MTFQLRWNPTLKQNLIPESQFLKGARLLVKRVVFPPQRLPSAEATRLLIYEKCGAPLAPDVLAAQLPTEHFMAVWQIDRADIGANIQFGAGKWRFGENLLLPYLGEKSSSNQLF